MHRKTNVEMVNCRKNTLNAENERMKSRKSSWNDMRNAGKRSWKIWTLERIEMAESKL